jgi:[protein-PII] uridylyltransferase
VRRRREEVRRQLGREAADPWFARQIEAMPPADLYGAPPSQAADDLRLLHGLERGDVQVRTRYRPDTQTVEVTVATSEEVTPGIFHKLTGAISSHGLEILSAQINTLADRLVLDRFQVRDPDHRGEPPAERLADVEHSLRRALLDSAGPPTFRRLWQFRGQEQPTVAKTRVEVDNSTSPTFTVLDIFAVDRPGLLYEVTRTLFELELSVWRAKIGTYLDQVVDVFYVTDPKGRKIEGETRLQQIRGRVLEVILELGRGG